MQLKQHCFAIIINPWDGKRIPKGSEETGYWHTHGNYTKEVGGVQVPTNRWEDEFISDEFSNVDLEVDRDISIGKG